MRYKPTFILFEQEGENTGIKMVKKFFVDEKRFDMDALRTLVVKYPYILGKTRNDIDSFFNLMNRLGLNEVEAMKALLECPKLISKNLEKQIKEITFLFNLYHGFTE